MNRVQINVSWFKKYNVFFIFHDTIFPTNPENQNTKGFCFLNGGTETKFFLAVKVKRNFNMIHISFLLKQLCRCCLDIRFFFLILIGVSFYFGAGLRKRVQYRYFPVIFTKLSQITCFIEHFQAPALLLLFESPIFWGFPYSNLRSVYLLVFWLWFGYYMLLFY